MVDSKGEVFIGMEKIMENCSSGPPATEEEVEANLLNKWDAAINELISVGRDLIRLNGITGFYDIIEPELLGCLYDLKDATKKN